MKKSIKKSQNGSAIRTDGTRPPSLNKEGMSKKELRKVATDSMRTARAANKAKKK